MMKAQASKKPRMEFLKIIKLIFHRGPNGLDQLNYRQCKDM